MTRVAAAAAAAAAAAIAAGVHTTVTSLRHVVSDDIEMTEPSGRAATSAAIDHRRSADSAVSSAGNSGAYSWDRDIEMTGPEESIYAEPRGRGDVDKRKRSVSGGRR